MPDRTGSESLLASLFDFTEIGIISVALDGTIEKWSRGAEHLYGYSTGEMTGQPLKRIVALNEQASLETELRRAAGGNIQSSEVRERFHKNGSRILLNIKRTLIRTEQGDIQGILEIARALYVPGSDLPEEAPLPLLVEQMPVLLWTTDQNLTITSNWGTGLSSSKIRPGALVGSNVCEFLGCADRHAAPIAAHYDALRGVSSQFEHEWQDRVLEIHLAPLLLQSCIAVGCLGVGMDITSRKKTEEQTHYQARHDALTGLANYREFIDRLEREVRRGERSHHSFTLLLLDLDELKRVNDLYGHLAGNRALKRLAAVMNEHCRSTDLAARYGGDEFAVVLIDSDRGMAEQVALRIEAGLHADQEKPALSASIGIGVYPDDGRTTAALIEAADRRLYQRKKAQSSRTFSAP